MRRLKERFRSHSPVSPGAAEGSNAPSHSAQSNTLASIIKALEVAENAADGLPMKAPKAVISSIRIVLKSVKQSSDNEAALKRLEEQVSVLEASVLRPLEGCTEVPPALESAVDNLNDKVKAAAKKWEKKPEKPKRGRFMRSLVADQEADELQGFVDDIKDALQMFMTAANVDQILERFKKSVFEELNKIPHVGGAGYDSIRSNAPSRCFEGTRTAILNKIRDWLNRPISDTTVQIYWVNGLAGIGKSTLARTVAEDAHHPGPLGASFFFSRQDNELSDPRRFIPTIAYQLASSFPVVRPVITEIFLRNPDVVKMSFMTQFKDLIINPLRKIDHEKPVLLVADALDECNNSDGAAATLFHAVVACCAEVPFLRILVTSRPETYIKAILTGDATTGIVLHEDIEQSVVSEDIRKYLHEEMSNIWKRPGVERSSPWPSEADLDVLVSRAGKLFIWAATAIRFTRDCEEGDRDFRLRVLLGKHVGRGVDTEHPYGQLDDLYLAILSQAAAGVRKEFIARIQILVGTIVRLRSEMRLDVIGQFLEMDPVATTLGRIQSIIPIPTDTSQPIQIYHPSFPDFITNQERCPGSQFYVDIPSHEKRLALRCLDILNSGLSEDIDRLLKPTEDMSVLSEEAVLRTIPLEVQYACRFWAVHVTFQSVGHTGEELMTKLDVFSSKMLLRWVIAMSTLGAISDAIAATRTMQQWIDDSGPWSYLKEAFYDTERMMLAWSEFISQYPTQLYYSILPFLPSDTYLAHHYPTCGISILRGRDRSWSPVLFTLARGLELWEWTVFAPTGQMVAVASSSQIELFDALSGMPLSSIVGPEPPSKSRFNEVCGVTFNADASEVILVRRDNAYCDVIKYNVTRQIGRVHRTVPVESFFVRLSEGGSYVAFVGLERGIRIWQTDGGDDISILRDADDIKNISLSADSAHLVAAATDNTIIISDILSGNILQKLAHKDDSRGFMCISPDGSLLASRSLGAIRLWSTTRGTLLATFLGSEEALVFSHTNRLYMTLSSGGGSVCDMSVDRPVLVPFPFPANARRITLAPNGTQIAIQVNSDPRMSFDGQFRSDIQFWSLEHFRDTHVDPGPPSIIDISLSSDGLLLAISAQTKIEVWDVRTDQCRYVIQSESSTSNPRPIAFSPRGELIVSNSRYGIIVIDVQTGIIRPTIYSAKGRHDEAAIHNYRHFGISFDDSTLAASKWEHGTEIKIWDLPSGAHLHTVAGRYFRWSRIDSYLMYCNYSRKPSYLNAKTFQKEVPSDPGDRFQNHAHLRQEGNMLRIRSPRRKKDPLFLALPSHLKIKMFRCRGNTVSILSEEGQVLLLDISGLDAYMKEFCVMESDDDSDDVDDTYSIDSDW